MPSFLFTDCVLAGGLDMYVRSRMHAEELFNSRRYAHRRRIDIIEEIGVPNGVDSAKGEQIKERIT